MRPRGEHKKCLFDPVTAGLGAFWRFLDPLRTNTDTNISTQRHKPERYAAVTFLRTAICTAGLSAASLVAGVSAVAAEEVKHAVAPASVRPNSITPQSELIQVTAATSVASSVSPSSFPISSVSSLGNGYGALRVGAPLRRGVQGTAAGQAGKTRAGLASTLADLTSHKAVQTEVGEPGRLPTRSARDQAFVDGTYEIVSGAYGSLAFGQTSGAFDQLAVTAPSIFSTLGVKSWKGDLTADRGAQDILSQAGFAAKLAYLPPSNPASGNRDGVRVGLNYTSVLRDCVAQVCVGAAVGLPGADIISDAALSRQDISGRRGARANAEFISDGISSTWSDVFETSLYFENTIDVQKRPVRVGIGASYISADRAEQSDSSVIPQSDDYEAITVGLNLDYRWFSIGGSVKNARGGIGNLNLEEDYLAVETGVTLNLGSLSLALGYGEGTNISSDYFGLHRDSQSAQAGISYVFDRGVTVGAAAQFVQPKQDEISLDAEASVMFESSFKF